MTGDAEIHPVGFGCRIMNNAEVTVAADKIETFHMQAMVKVGAADKRVGHDVRQAFAQSEFRIDNIIKHPHLYQFHRALGSFANLFVAFVRMAKHAVPGWHQVWWRIVQYLQFFFLGNSQLHVGVFQATHFSFHITKNAGTAMAIKTGYASITVG